MYITIVNVYRIIATFLHYMYYLHGVRKSATGHQLPLTLVGAFLHNLKRQGLRLEDAVRDDGVRDGSGKRIVIDMENTSSHSDHYRFCLK
jgi:hypothetical protein